MLATEPAKSRFKSSRKWGRGRNLRYAGAIRQGVDSNIKKAMSPELGTIHSIDPMEDPIKGS